MSMEESSWWIALFGTLAGIVGAVVAVIQLRQSRSREERPERSGPARLYVGGPRRDSATRSSTLHRLAEEELDDDDLETIQWGATAIGGTLLYFFIGWIVIRVFGLRAETWPVWWILLLPLIASSLWTPMSTYWAVRGWLSGKRKFSLIYVGFATILLLVFLVAFFVGGTPKLLL